MNWKTDWLTLIASSGLIAMAALRPPTASERRQLFLPSCTR